MTVAAILLPLLVAVAGALVYAFATNPKLVQIGLVLFQVGALWTVYVLSRVEVRF